MFFIEPKYHKSQILPQRALESVQHAAPPVLRPSIQIRKNSKNPLMGKEMFYIEKQLK